MTVENFVVNLVDQYKVEQQQAVKRYTDFYLAYDVDENRTVTLDVLRAAEVQTWFATQFANRARAIAQIRHPNIARILTVGRTPTDQPYVAQALLDGYPLSQRLDQLTARPGSVNTIYALKLVRQLADALLLATRLDLLHYDLRPQNIMLRNVSLPTDDVLVLSDLFVPFERQSWAESDDEELLAYLSPEQRAGKEIDVASHVYTLGVLAYHLLASTPPTGPTESHEVLVRRLTAGGSSLARVRDDLSPETYELIDRALRKDPRQRQGSIEAFTIELERALLAEELQVGADKISTTTPARRSWILLTALVLLALGTVASITGWRLMSDQQLQATVTTVAIGTIPENQAGVALSTVSPDLADDGGGGTGGSDQPAAVASANISAPLIVGAVLSATSTATEQSVQTSSPTARPTATVTPTAPSTPTTEPQTTSTAVVPTPVPAVRVILNSVYLRRGPGTNYPPIGTLLEGDEVMALARFGEGDSLWFEVSKGDGPIGWLSAAVVQLVDGVIENIIPTAASIPSTPTPTATPTTTPSPTPLATGTATSSDDGGGDGGGSVNPPPATQAPQPTEPVVNPTRTPPPFEP